MKCPRNAKKRFEIHFLVQSISRYLKKLHKKIFVRSIDRYLPRFSRLKHYLIAEKKITARLSWNFPNTSIKNIEREGFESENIIKLVMASTMGRIFNVEVNAIFFSIEKFNCVWDVHKLYDHECKSAVIYAAGKKTGNNVFVIRETQ